MKKNNLIAIFIFSLVILTPVAQAEEVNSDVTVETTVNVREKRMRPVQSRPFEKGEVREKMHEMNGEKERSGVFVHAKQIANRRFIIVISKLENIQTRLTERLDILKSEGKDISAPEIKLNASKEALIDAKEYKDQIATIFDEVTENSDKTAVKAEVKELFGKLKESLKVAHSQLKEAIKLTKSLTSNVEESTE